MKNHKITLSNVEARSSHDKNAKPDVYADINIDGTVIEKVLFQDDDGNGFFVSRAEGYDQAEKITQIATALGYAGDDGDRAENEACALETLHAALYETEIAEIVSAAWDESMEAVVAKLRDCETLFRSHHQPAYDAAARGLMHHSYCTDDNASEEYEFFATREEAEADAYNRTGYDEDSGGYWHFEARSVAWDEVGDLVIIEEVNA